MLLAFVALIAMLNGFVGWAGSLVGIDSLTIQLILGYVAGFCRIDCDAERLCWLGGQPGGY